MAVDLERIARANLKELGDIRIDDVLSFIDRGIENMPSYMDLYRRWESQQWAVADIDFTLDRQDWLEATDLDRKATLWSHRLFFNGEERSEERRVGKECRGRESAYQAEDGIRDKLVTGVQTCALPIFLHRPRHREHAQLHGSLPQVGVAAVGGRRHRLHPRSPGLARGDRPRPEGDPVVAPALLQRRG